jgi:uncharacterized protein with HEPN domain
MQRDAVYLADILSAAADLREFARSASLEEFCSNKTLRYAPRADGDRGSQFEGERRT